MSELNMDDDRAAALWNAQADQHNQWSELDADEKAAWIAKCAAPVGEVELPALPTAEIPAYGDAAPLYTAEQVRQAQSDAIAPYAERIRVLEREMAEQKSASIGDDDEFHELLGRFRNAHLLNTEDRANDIIAYIDGRAAGAAPDGWVEDLAMLVRLLVRALSGANPDNRLIPRAMDYLKRKGLEGSPLRAAAPSPQHGKEGGND